MLGLFHCEMKPLSGKKSGCLVSDSVTVVPTLGLSASKVGTKIGVAGCMGMIEREL